MPALRPDNEVAWEITRLMLTQSRTAGLGSFIGIDLNSLPTVLNAYGIPKNDWKFYVEVMVEVGSVAARHWNKVDETEK